MLKTKVKTKFQGLVWVHERYVKSLEEGRSLLIEHQGKWMTVTPDFFKEKPPKKGVESFREKFGSDRGKYYYLYGFKFIPDDNQELTKKKAKPSSQEVLAQCPKCKAIKVTVKRGFGWQNTFVEFNHLPTEECPKCKTE